MIVTDTITIFYQVFNFFGVFFGGSHHDSFMKIKKKKLGHHLYPGCCTEPGHPCQIYLGFRTNLVQNFVNLRQIKTYLQPKFQNSIRDQHPPLRWLSGVLGYKNKSINTSAKFIFSFNYFIIFSATLQYLVVFTIFGTTWIYLFFCNLLFPESKKMCPSVSQQTKK